MSGIGLWELIIIAIIALIIIGPERLPEFARDTGKFVNTLCKFVNNAKSELEKELELDEINSLHKNINHIDRLMKEAPDRELTNKAENNDDNKINT
jgi:sec-independent protein translocase protein TatB